ncbi:uncharacterized protein LOC132902093 [Amyelois transitella]|uniref:uncharacterized protein LOC132902093 n=1 Tax=Amyelois transitella TaxID=680683 RepID=UPI00298F6D5F|nr:uncharacterized protein LOC132902093 [Amyelois transitella]
MWIVLLLLAFGAAQAQLECTMARSGVHIPGSVPVKGGLAKLLPGVSTWVIKFSPPCDHSMLQIDVCDEDVKPEVKILSVTEVIITRKGSVDGTIFARGIFWCPAIPMGY